MFYRNLKNDYTMADMMYEKGNTLTEISRVTGIKQNTLHSHFFTGNYKRDKSLVLEQQIRYKERLDEMLQKRSVFTGVRDWTTPEGQQVLERFASKKEFIIDHNYEEVFPNMEGL